MQLARPLAKAAEGLQDPQEAATTAEPAATAAEPAAKRAKVDLRQVFGHHLPE